MPSLKAYWGVTVSLADTDGAKQLYALCAAVDDSVPIQCSKVQIQSHDTNGANPLDIGDRDIDATRRGVRLLKHEGQPAIHSVASGLPWSEMYVFNPTAGTTLAINVEIWL